MIYNDQLHVACRRAQAGIKSLAVTHLAQVLTLSHVQRPRDWSLRDSVTPATSLTKANTESLVCWLLWNVQPRQENVRVCQKKFALIHLCEECALKVKSLSCRLSSHQSSCELNSPKQNAAHIKPYEEKFMFLRHYPREGKIHLLFI